MKDVNRRRVRKKRFMIIEYTVQLNIRYNYVLLKNRCGKHFRGDFLYAFLCGEYNIFLRRI